MAIYQFYLAVIPRIGLLKKHNSLPSKISIGTESKYFESNTEVYWKLAELNPDEFIREIDNLIKRADWGNGKTTINWKTYSENVDNDAWMSITEDTRTISELSFRADLRETELKFLIGMLDFSNRNNLVLMDRKGNIANPNFEEIKTLIVDSNSYKFLIDPEKFLTELGNGKLKPE